MDARDRETIILRYNQRLASYGDDIRTLASGTEERRKIRFDVLREVGIQSGDSVLDVGCGFGDFSAYLQSSGLEVQYTGIDINESLIEIAKQKYNNAQFAVMDIEIDSIPEVDIIVSSSAFNLPLQATSNYEFVQRILKRFHAQARKAVAVDFMSSYVDYQSPEAFHYNPVTVFESAKAITKRVCLRHDYPLYEFCIYLYPDFQGWGKNRD